MAVSLRAWLHDQVKIQLELGHSWLQAKNTATATSDRRPAAVDRRWEGLYHDNGSCIDIAGPLSSLQALVLVLGTDPLTITDGRHHTESALTGACRDRLRARFPGRETSAGTVWAITSYTIRYTSYGPPRNKLRLILDAVEWLGETHQRPVRVDPANALNRSDEIASALLLLHRARVREDDRCLRPQLKEEEDLHARTHTMAGAEEPPDGDASMDTQMPFGLQAQHPISPRTHHYDVAFVGINRLEPVLAGNTQRAELKPRSATATDERQKQLLGLLRIPQPPPAPQPQNPGPANSTPEPRPSVDRTATTPPRRRETPAKRANRERTRDMVPIPTATPPDKGKKRMREAENESPPTHYSAKKTSFTGEEPKQSRVSQMDKFAAECAWMKGLKLNRASSTVPDDQAYILQKPESWYKPQAGPPRLEGNIPIKTLMILSRVEDEKAALEGATSSGSYHDADPSSASYPSHSAPQLMEEPSSESEAEAPTSPVSWHTSPSPEPPQRPLSPHQGLPPDSSNELLQDAAETATSQSAGKQNQSPHSTLPASSHENEIDLPPSSPPAHHAAHDSDDDMELETSVPQALGEDLDAQPAIHPIRDRRPHTEPRSKSVVQVKETPYLKSKNGQQPVVTISPPTQQSNGHLEHSSSASIVRGTYQDVSYSVVEETLLNVRRKDNGENRQDATATKLQAHTEDDHVLPDHDAQDTSRFNMFAHEEPPSDPAQQDDSEKQRRYLPTEAIQGTGPAQPEPTPMSAQLPLKDSSSGEQTAPPPFISASVIPVQSEREPSGQPSVTPSLTKRKLETTPPRERRRPSRHKRLKIVSFGSGPRGSEHERQQSSTSAESRQGSVSNLSVQQVPDTKMKDLDSTEPIKPQVEPNAAPEGNMSPRHRSLYATPSPVLRPAAPVTTESIRIDHPEKEASQGSVTGQGIPGQAVETQQPQAPLPESPPELQTVPVPVSASESVPQPTPKVLAGAEQAPSATPAKGPAPTTIFEEFKVAYPDYKGTVKHFTNQCARMEELDREDKMVPKWMWDDFIIRNQTDYRVYASECLDSGEEPMPYIRFYKDTIRDAVYKKGVIETRAVLLKALQELGVQPRTAKKPPPMHLVQEAVQQPRQPSPQSQEHPVQYSPQRSIQPAQRQTQSPRPPPDRPATTPPKKPSRKSLPFPVPNAPTPHRVNRTSCVRHSLPASSSHTAPSPTPTSTASSRPTPSARQKSKSTFGDRLRHYSTNLPSSSLESGTGNEWRDWLKAQPKLTSITGSKRVDLDKPWPKKVEVRPSVRDLSKKKIDVLSWGDEL